MKDEERNYNLPEFASAVPMSSNPGETMAAKVGGPAPDFEACALDGTMVRLSHFRGKRHVVFMTGAVTSPMCAFEVPALNQIQQEFASRHETRRQQGHHNAGGRADSEPAERFDERRRR